MSSGWVRNERNKKWTLLGYDTLSDEVYHLPGKFDSEEEALKAARERLKKLEELQPSKDSGGQSEMGIQDHVYIVSPESIRIRVLEKGNQDSLAAYT